MSYSRPLTNATSSVTSSQNFTTTSSTSSSASTQPLTTAQNAIFSKFDYYAMPISLRDHLSVQRRYSSVKSEPSYQKQANLMATPAPELWHPESFYPVSDLLDLIFPNNSNNPSIIIGFKECEVNLRQGALFALNLALTTLQERVDSHNYHIEHREILYLYQLHCRIPHLNLPVINTIQSTLFALYKKMAFQLTLEEKGQLARFAKLLDSPIANHFRSAIFPCLFKHAAVSQKPLSDQWISVQQTLRKIIEVVQDLKKASPHAIIQNYQLDTEFHHVQFSNLLANLESYCYLSLAKLLNGQEVELPKYYYFGCFNKLNQNHTIKYEELLKPLTPLDLDGYLSEYKGVIVSTTLEDLFAKEAIALPDSIEWREDLTNFGIPSTATKNGQYWLGLDRAIPLCRNTMQRQVKAHQISALIVREDRIEEQKVELAKNEFTTRLNVWSSLEAKLLNAILLNEFPLFFPEHFSIKTKIRNGANGALSLNPSPSTPPQTIDQVIALYGTKIFSQQNSPAPYTQSYPFQPPLPPHFFPSPNLCAFHAHQVHHNPIHPHPHAPYLCPQHSHHAHPSTSFHPHLVLPLPCQQMAPNAAIQPSVMPYPPIQQHQNYHAPSSGPSQQQAKRAKTTNQTTPHSNCTIHHLKPILIKPSYEQVLTHSSNFYSSIVRKFGPEDLSHHPKAYDFLKDGVNEWFIQHPNFSLQLFLNQVNVRSAALRLAIREGFLNNGKELPKNPAEDHLIAITEEQKRRNRLFRSLEHSFPSAIIPPSMRHTWADIKEDSMFGQIVGQNPFIYFNFKSIQSLLYYHGIFAREEIKNMEHLLSESRDSSVFNGPKGTLFDRIRSGNSEAAKHFFTFLACKIIQSAKLSSLNSDILECPIHPENEYARKAYVDFNTFETTPADGSDRRLTINEPALIWQLYNELSVIEKESLPEYVTGKQLPSYFSEVNEKRMQLITHFLREMGGAIASRYFSNRSSQQDSSLPVKLDNSPLRGLLLNETIDMIQNSPNFNDLVYSLDHLK